MRNPGGLDSRPAAEAIALGGRVNIVPVIVAKTSLETGQQRRQQHERRRQPD